MNLWYLSLAVVLGLGGWWASMPETRRKRKVGGLRASLREPRLLTPARVAEWRKTKGARA